MNAAEAATTIDSRYIVNLPVPTQVSWTPSPPVTECFATDRCRVSFRYSSCRLSPLAETIITDAGRATSSVLSVTSAASRD